MAARRCPGTFALFPTLGSPGARSSTTARLPNANEKSLLTISSLGHSRLIMTRAPKSKPCYPKIFTLREIPRASFERVIARSGHSFELSSLDRYYDCAQRFSEAVMQGSSPYTVSLGGKDPPSVETLHEVACIMSHIRSVQSAGAFATAMWASASELGFRPSTLSLARQLIRFGTYGNNFLLRRVEARFRQLVSTGKDPDALTAEGELLYGQRRYDLAAATLQRALRIPSPSFEWKPYCNLCLAKAFMKLGRHEEARSLLEALSESGLIDAEIELGRMLRTSDRDKAEQHIYAAACRGRPNMFSHLSEMALEKGSTTADDGSREDSLRWATEWSRLANPQADH